MVLLVLHACHVVLLLVLRWFWCGSTEIPSCPAPAAPDASLTRGRGRLWCTTRGRFECPRPGTVAGCGGMARWLGTWPGAVAGHGGRAGSPCPNPMSLPQGPCPNPSPNPCPNPMSLPQGYVDSHAGARLLLKAMTKVRFLFTQRDSACESAKP